MATFSSGVKCFRSFLIRSLRYLNGRTLSPFPTEAGQSQSQGCNNAISNPLHARDHVETVLTRRTALCDTHQAFGLSSNFRFATPYWTAIGQSKFRSGLASTRQLLKRLLTTMIPTSRLFALLGAEDE
jgi:hypothetical protein